MIVKAITYFGQPCAVACDACCHKAWGIHSRPRRQLSDNPDDYVWLSDGELGQAPTDPGTYEGSDSKPVQPEERLNKWCVRECERSVLVPHGKVGTLPDFAQPEPNLRWSSG